MSTSEFWYLAVRAMERDGFIYDGNVRGYRSGDVWIVVGEDMETVCAYADGLEEPVRASIYEWPRAVLVAIGDTENLDAAPMGDVGFMGVASTKP